MPRLLHAGLVAMLLGIGVGVAVPQLAAQKSAPTAKADKEALPFWAPPEPKAREDLGATTRQLSRAIILVGHPKAGFGTAWVLSAKHRLLVTNAHVADIIGVKGELLAVVNGTEQSYKVKRVLYHPMVRRRIPGGGISIRAECPKDGDIDEKSADLAVLELTDDGPALTAELTLATPEELDALYAQTVGMLGFPAHSVGELDKATGRLKLAWPSLGEKPQATFHDGVISRLTDFRYKTNVPKEDLQFVQSTLANWWGFSGSPIYLSNGHVVAINNSLRFDEKYGVKTTICQAIRVDCVWELLVYRGLDKLVPVPSEKSRARAQRWKDEGLEPTESEKQFRRAVQLVDEAANAVDFKQDFQAGIKKCTEALELAPSYPDAYRVRCAALNNYYFYSRARLGKDQARDVLDSALKDAKKYADLMSTDARFITTLVNTANNYAALSKSSGSCKECLTLLDKALRSDNLSKPQRAEFLSLRGMCRFNSQQNGARDDFDESIRLDPENDVLYDNRANYWEALKKTEKADDDRTRARAIRRTNLERMKEKP